MNSFFSTKLDKTTLSIVYSVLERWVSNHVYHYRSLLPHFSNHTGLIVCFWPMDPSSPPWSTLGNAGKANKLNFFLQHATNQYHNKHYATTIKTRWWIGYKVTWYSDSLDCPTGLTTILRLLYGKWIIIAALFEMGMWDAILVELHMLPVNDTTTSVLCTPAGNSLSKVPHRNQDNI